MPFRFRRSLKLFRGVRLNIGKGGPSSVSVGRRGARLTVGRRGARVTAGLPGTGLSWSTPTRMGRGRSGLVLIVVALVVLLLLAMLM